MVWIEKEREAQEPPVQIMVSVSKRHFKHAVKRNRVKRQLREAYRLAKPPLVEMMEKTPQRTLLIAFIWLADELYSSAAVASRMEQLLLRLMEKL
jgi:ribonuclease P protein component